VTFLISFLATFVAGYALLTLMTSENGGYNVRMMMMGTVGINLTPLVMLFEVSLLMAAIFSALNYLENRRIIQSYDRDIERLSKNEQPENEELEKVLARVQQLSAELQKLSADKTATRSAIVEEERKRISRELHDSVSQELFAAAMILSAVTDIQQPIATEQMQTQTRLALKILHEAQNEMRALLLHLRPTELDGKSLVSGLRGLIDELSAKISSNINYKLSEIESSPNVEDNLFRMAQEILSNALRHSQAENIEISLQEKGHNIFLKIKDDGIGFEPTKVKQASYGLKNLSERALLLGGDCSILSKPGEGTQVEIRIPVLATAKENEWKK
jgi:NarL family two-component system sensor histidine kinase LiaS